MSELIFVRKGSYHDSGRLMAIARELKTLPGVREAEVLMGTPMNVELLAQAGFASPELHDATPLDMVVALRGERAGGLREIEGKLDELLAGAKPSGEAREAGPRSLTEALAAHTAANVVSVAVPGAYAAFVAHRALDAGRHVFLFSDNVALDDEVALKEKACGLGLLLMGPDCGTAILSGVGFGFANRVRRGPVGIVGASGTGIQEVSCILDGLGAGVSHAIGTGSRDLSAPVGGRMTEFGLRLLAGDPSTHVIALVAKHPHPAVAARIHGVLARLGKPVVVRYLGEAGRGAIDGIVYADSLDEAAAAAATAALCGALPPAAPGGPPKPAAPGGPTKSAAPDRAASPGARTANPAGAPALAGNRLVGLFSGGSLAAEAGHVLRGCGIETTIPDRALHPGHAIESGGHLIVDTGDDSYTVGRPHPMVDQTLRCDLMRTAGADPSVGVILFDLVLGDGAHPDPAPEIVAAVNDARSARGAGPIEIIASLCGTADDPQDRDRQERVLREAGIHVETSASRAALSAAERIGASGNRP